MFLFSNEFRKQKTIFKTNSAIIVQGQVLVKVSFVDTTDDDDDIEKVAR